MIENSYSKTIRLALAFSVGLTCVSASEIFAQDQKDGGQIEDVQIEWTKEKQITLPKANRSFEKIPPRPAEPITPAITYDFKPLRFTAPDYNPVVKPLRLKDELPSKIYGNYVSVGFGNYNSPFLRGSFSSKRDAEKAYGVDLFHRSFGKGSVRGDDSGSGYTKIDGFYSGIGAKVTADLGLQYERIMAKFYGFTPIASDKSPAVKQEFNIVGLSGAVSNTKPGDFNFKLAGDFSYLDDALKAAESEVGLHFNSSYKISENQSILLRSDYILAARKDEKVEAKPRHLFRVNPAYQFLIADKLRLSAGFNSVVANDTIQEKKKVHIYPDAWINYDITKEFGAYAGITGDYDKVTLHTLARENPWLNSNIPLSHTNRAFEFRGGLKGKVARKLSIHAGTALVNFKHMYFYKNNPTTPQRFDLVYDNTVRLNFFAELGFNHSEKANISTRIDYFNYSMKTIDYPWNRPTYKAGVYSWFKPIDKIMITIDFVSQGGMKGYDYGTSKVVSLPTVVNLDAKVRYFMSKRFSAFVEGSNILNSKYYMYQNYLARGAQVSLGASWSF